MKIVVLSGGFCTERHVGLVSGSGVCRALREKGHQAIFVDMFMGLENYQGKLEDIFDAPDGLLERWLSRRRPLIWRLSGRRGRTKAPPCWARTC